MEKRAPKSSVYLARSPLYSALQSVATTCYVATLLTDLAYARTANMMWADFSAWLVIAGAIIAIVAAIASITGWLISRQSRASTTWPHAILGVAVLALAIVNTLVHTRDAWTSVVPWGLTLSALTVLAQLASAWLGWLGASRVRTYDVH